jgi:hypothetical protein
MGFNVSYSHGSSILCIGMLFVFLTPLFYLNVTPYRLGEVFSLSVEVRC